MAEAFICEYIRTPIGRFGGSLSSVRADDLGAVPLKALVERNSGVDWAAVEDVVYGCANQAKEQYGVDSMPETGENVAEYFSISRADQDAFAARSQDRAMAAQLMGGWGKRSPLWPFRKKGCRDPRRKG